MTPQLEPRTVELLRGLATDPAFRAAMSTLSYDVIASVSEWLAANGPLLTRSGRGDQGDQGDHVFALLMGWVIGLGEPGIDIPRLLRAVEIGAEASQAIARDVTKRERH